MNKKKIALFFFGNINYDGRSYNMIKTLSENNYCVEVYHLSNKTEIKKNISLIGLQNNYKSGFFKFYRWFQMIKKISLDSYSSVIASDLYSLVGLRLNSKSFVVYDVRDFFDELPSLKNKPFKKIIWKTVEKKCLPFVKTIITTSNKDKEVIKKKFKAFTHLQYYTIYNYPLLCNHKKNNYLRSKFNINPNNKILIYQGVIEKGRGVGLLIKIISIVKGCACVIVGGGPDLLFFKQVVSSLNLKHKVFFHKKVPYVDLLKITLSADVGISFIRPTCKNNIYALPNKIFEYSICGLPVLSSNMPGITTTIKKYNLGKCCNIYNQNHIIDAVKEISQKSFLNEKKSLIKNIAWKSQEEKFLNIFKL